MVEGRWSFKSPTVAFISLKWRTSSGLYSLATGSGFGVAGKRADWGTRAEGTSTDGEPLWGIYLVVSSF